MEHIISSPPSQTPGEALGYSASLKGQGQQSHLPAIPHSPVASKLHHYILGALCSLKELLQQIFRTKHRPPDRTIVDSRSFEPSDLQILLASQWLDVSQANTGNLKSPPSHPDTPPLHELVHSTPVSSANGPYVQRVVDSIQEVSRPPLQVLFVGLSLIHRNWIRARVKLARKPRTRCLSSCSGFPPSTTSFLRSLSSKGSAVRAATTMDWGE